MSANLGETNKHWSRSEHFNRKSTRDSLRLPANEDSFPNSFCAFLADWQTKEESLMQVYKDIFSGGPIINFSSPPLPPTNAFFGPFCISLFATDLTPSLLNECERWSLRTLLGAAGSCQQGFLSCLHGRP